MCVTLFRVLVLGGVLLACRALGAQVEIPVRVSLETLTEALATQLAAASYREGPCRYLKLGTPTVQADGARLRLAVPGSGALGVAMALGAVAIEKRPLVGERLLRRLRASDRHQSQRR